MKGKCCDKVLTMKGESREHFSRFCQSCRRTFTQRKRVSARYIASLPLKG